MSYTQHYSARQTPEFPCIHTTFTNPVNANLQTEEKEVLVDSGSTVTCISDSVIEKLGLVPCGNTSVRDFEDRVVDNKMVYFIKVSFGRFNFVVKAIQTNGHPIIGRDIINQLTVILNGPAQKLEVKQ